MLHTTYCTVAVNVLWRRVCLNLELFLKFLSDFECSWRAILRSTNLYSHLLTFTERVMVDADDCNASRSAELDGERAWQPS